MSWVYCKCGCGLGTPSAREVLLDWYICPNCGESNNPCVTKEEVIADMLDRLEELEREIKHLKEGTQP